MTLEIQISEVRLQNALGGPPGVGHDIRKSAPGASTSFWAGSWPVERFPRRLKKLRPWKHRGEGRADRGAAAGAAVREPHGRGSGRR